MPLLNGILCFQFKLFNKLTSSNFLGVSSGLLMSQMSVPLNPTIAIIVFAISRLDKSLPRPMLIWVSKTDLQASEMPYQIKL